MTSILDGPHLPTHDRRVTIGRAAMLSAVALGLASLGCALIRLNGCNKLADCSDDLRAYSCGDQLVCADREGNTLRSEMASTWRNACRICEAR